MADKTPENLVRLNKLLARYGIASRRGADLLIRQGRVTVNGRRVTNVGLKVSPDAKLRVDGSPVDSPPPLEYVMLNKPPGIVTTRREQTNRPTVMDLLPPELRHLHPVGRLDRDTTGLLLLTNDGELTLRLTHPRHGCEKRYVVTIQGRLTPRDLTQLRRGILLKDGQTSPAKCRILEEPEDCTVVELTIREGRKRQVRRMFEALGKPVLALTRTALGPLALEGLRQGEWRRLTEWEVQALRQATQEMSTKPRCEPNT